MKNHTEKMPVMEKLLKINVVKAQKTKSQSSWRVHMSRIVGELRITKAVLQGKDENLTGNQTQTHLLMM